MTTWRARQLGQCGSAMRRLLRNWSEFLDHRRRVSGFVAGSGAGTASEADLRLLLLTREAKPTELAAHIRRVMGLVDEDGDDS